MKKLLLVIFLLIPFTVKAELKPIYDVLKDEAENGTLAEEYTREHQDTTDGTGTDKIYHWHATNNETANTINDKRNVLFAGFCWQSIRTTDSGGTKLIYNGVPEADGKCLGNNQIAQSAGFVTYNEVYSMGAAGYMYNKLYNTSAYVTPRYGYYTQPGNKFAEDDYVVVSNNSTTPFTFDSYYGWRPGKNGGYTQDGSITFKAKESGNYNLYFYFNRDSYYDEVNIYKNNELIANITRHNDAKYDSIPLGEVLDTDEFKIDIDVDYSDNTSIAYFYMIKPTGEATDTRAYFGNSVEWVDGQYVLKDTIRGDGTIELSNNHYFCEDGSIRCTSVYYIMNFWTPRLTAWKLDNGMTIEQYVYDQLYADDVNVNDSILKQHIDAWFEENMLDYEEYLEDTVFCQDRNLAYENNTLNPNGGNPGGGSPRLYFYQEGSYWDGIDASDALEYNTNLKCENVTDRFSVSNEKAKLTYPVATINLAEALLLSNSTSDNDGGIVRGFNRGNSDYYSYWLLSPNSIGTAFNGWSVSSSGYMSYSYGTNSSGIRPVVSLKPGTMYTKGDGSKANPYVIREYIYSKVEVDNDSSKGTVKVQEEDQDAILNYTDVKFVIAPKKGYIIDTIEVIDKDNNSIPFGKTNKLNEYSFVMPDTDTTIKVTFKDNDKNFSIVKGVNQIINKDNPDELIFGLDTEKELLDNSEIYIDNELVDPDNYTIGEDLTIHFDEDYTKKLDNGDHTITIILDGVYQLTTDFKVIDGRVNPETGNNIVKIVIIGLAALYGFIYLIQNKKRLNITRYKSID